MKKLLTSAVLVSCCALLSACSVNAVKAPEKAAKPVVLEGTSWMMQVPAEAECAVTPMLEFGPNNTVTGDLGCNRASGSFEFDGTNILFDKVATTRKMCGKKYMALEEQMLNMMSGARSVKLTEKGLTFLDADGKELMTMVPEMAGACN